MDERFARMGHGFRPVRLQPWKVWALAAVGGALSLAVAVAVAGLFLILVPILLLGGLAAKLLLGWGRHDQRQPDQAGPPGVIEGHYEVIAVERERRRT